MTGMNHVNKPDLTNWDEILHTSIATQFKDAYDETAEHGSSRNSLVLPKHFYNYYSNPRFKDWNSTRIEILSYVAINHPNSIVRTKACIILSRNSNGLDFDPKREEWDIDVLRQLISTDWNDIIYNITPRWCISILNCFAEHGDNNERVVANSIVMIHNTMSPDSIGIIPNISDKTASDLRANPIPYKANDTFMYSMLRINQSLTDEVRLVTLAYMNLLGSDYAWYRNRFTDIANVWKMIIEMKLTSMSEVNDIIDLVTSVRGLIGRKPL